MTTMDAAAVTRWLDEAGQDIADQAEQLTALDAAIGDADHGTNMRRGFNAVREGLAEQPPEATPGQLLDLAGRRLISAVGGAAGPLWGQALRRAGRAMGELDRVDAATLADALDAGVAAMAKLGGAQTGDKTMIDALQPAAISLREAVEAGRPLQEAVAAAAGAARAGAAATGPMLARRGRAAYLGERSIGHDDPGATSAAIIVEALRRSVGSDAGTPSAR